MAEKQIQEFLFQRIKEAMPKGQSLVDIVAGVLCISEDSAYRRIRGETPLVLEEAKILCRQHNISLDQLLDISGNEIVFKNIELDNTRTDFKTYLEGILHQIQQLAAVNQKTLIYLTKDIPVFHLFCCTPVIAFRYFFWMKTMLQHPEFTQQKFSLNCLPPEIETLSKEILSIYCKIPSVEIWNTEAINSILVQINYYMEAGLMTKQDAHVVHKGLRMMLEHLQVQAECGRKFLQGENQQSKKENFQLFYNRVGLGDTTIVTLQNENKTVYLNYDVLNYLATTDESFCNQVHKKLQNIMRRSTLISSGSEKHRNIFFNRLRSKIPELEFLKENTWQ